MLHRDWKPDNIFLDIRTLQVKVGDFGISAWSYDRKEDDVVGTAAYLSPEGGVAREVDLRSEIFSFGIMMYELLTFERPFGQGDTPIAQALHHFHDDPKPLSDYPQLLERLGKDRVEQLDKVFAKGLAKEPGERYQTAGEFAEAFVEALGV